MPIITDGGMTTGGDICKALASGADAVMIGSAFARAKEAPGRGYHWGMATPHSNLPRGTRIRVGIAGPLEQILFGPAFTEDGTLNLVGAIRTCMGSVGARRHPRAAADGAHHRARRSRPRARCSSAPRSWAPRARSRAVSAIRGSRMALTAVGARDGASANPISTLRRCDDGQDCDPRLRRRSTPS